ncbi:MAG: PspC domain-containing protein [candidate division KSB1 bacterium]|nr:PspC domain-containing protein [candidate division KSB1 bacterium]
MSGEMKKLYRSSQDRMIGGVCAGIAEYFGVDATVIRLVWVVLTLMNGVGLLVYLLCMAMIPQKESSEITEKQEQKSSEWSLYFGVALIAIGLYFLMHQRFPWFPFKWPWHLWHSIRHFFWQSIFIFAGLLLILRGVRGDDSAPQGGSKLRFSRSRRYRMIAGVCGGIAEHLQVDPSLIRIAFIGLALLTGFWLGVGIYLVLALAVPEEPVES